METRAEAAAAGGAHPLPAPNRASAEEEVLERAETVRTGVPGAQPRARVQLGMLENAHGRVAILDGCRIPFSRAGTAYLHMNTVDLAAAAVTELVTRNDLDPEEIGLSIFGVVMPTLDAPNLGREVLFRASLPMSIPGTTVNFACASSCRAITSGAEAIATGQCSVVLAGGAESLSNVPVRLSDTAAHALAAFSKARTTGRKLAILSRLRPRDLAPVAPAIAEHTTGLRMGDSGELMARENDISRQAQDEIALMSHLRAAAAASAGRFDKQVVPVFPPPRRNEAVTTDNGVRPDASMEALSGLKPAFDKRYGTLTAGNSSPITDGGAAVLLMSEERAKALGYEPLGYIRSFAYAALDPAAQLLQGPAYAVPATLDQAGITWSDLNLVEMHEAFASQILSNLKALASKRFAEEELGRNEPVGRIDFDRFNVNGGSIAVGHPFGATGARVILQLLYELERRGEGLGLATVCAAGGIGFAMVVERD